ncbi:glutathione S-transferase family protein [Sphingomonas flavalba]|uniref:glutathione S-transferase family protein n=1 Tax=Sphingomonas flavalba TaxID=2559804 RepID=UPI0039E164CD
MILYGASLSPFVRKVLIFGAEKGIAIERKSIGPGDADPDFRRASPFGKIPALVDGDFALADSTAIVAYLEAKYPEPSMTPVDPRDRARVVWLEEFADTILSPAGLAVFFNMFVAKMVGVKPDMAAADKARSETLPPILDYVETVLPDDGGPLVGGMVTVADIAIACQIANIAYCGIALDDGGRRPKLARFHAEWSERPSARELVAGNLAVVARG